MKPGESTIFTARKFPSRTSGAVGVIGYQVETPGKKTKIAAKPTVAIYFRVAYLNLYKLKCNRWNVMLVKESMVNKDTYKSLLKGYIVADGSWFENIELKNPELIEEDIQLQFSGSMSPSSKSNLQVCIQEIKK